MLRKEARPFVNLAAQRHLGGLRNLGLLRAYRNNRDIQDAVTQLAMEAHDSDVATAAATDDPAPPAGRFQTFLQWLLDNSDKLIAFIKQIVALFSSAPA